MQPFAVSRDVVSKLRGDAAVWRRLDTRKPEIVECFFSAGAQACCEQRQRREHGHNADIHVIDYTLGFWARSWRLNADFRLYREALVASGGCANLLPAEFCRSGRQHVAAIS
jgi:hypothetical protein